MDGNERLRAWLLVKADPNVLDGVIEKIWLLDDKARDTVVIVRADRVGGDQFNLIVPIDFNASDEYYSQTLSEVESIEGVEKVIGFPVLSPNGHNPAPPHSAEGFMTIAEFEQYPPPSGIKPGRQRNSPGFTPWG
jgi:hypothetical protein